MGPEPGLSHCADELTDHDAELTLNTRSPTAVPSTVLTRRRSPGAVAVYLREAKQRTGLQLVRGI